MPVPLAESALAVRRQAELGSLTLQNTGNCSLRHVVLNGGDATIWRDSGARVGAAHFHIFLLLLLVNPQKYVGSVVFMSWRAIAVRRTASLRSPIAVPRTASLRSPIAVRRTASLRPPMGA